MLRSWYDALTRQGMKSGRKVLMALLCATLGAWAAGVAAASVHGVITVVLEGRAYKIGDALFVTLFPSVFSLPAGLVLTVVFGSIIHFGLGAFRLRHWAAYALAGVLAGCGLAVFLDSAVDCSESTRTACTTNLELLALAAAFGAAPGLGGALTFRAMLRPRREPARPVL